MPRITRFCEKTPELGEIIEPNSSASVVQLMSWNRATAPLLDALDAEWIENTQEAPLFFLPAWLSGLEQHNTGWQAEGWRWYRKDGTAAARAVVHRVSVSTNQGDTYVQTDRASTGGAFRNLLRRWAPKGFNTTVVGPLFATDLNPIYFHSSATEDEKISITQDLASALLREKSSVLLVKDAGVPLAQEQTNWLHRGFHPYEVEPLMELTLDPDWKNETDYFAAFKTKFRTKALSVRSRSASCRSVSVCAENWDLWFPALKDLYQQVESRAGFKLHPFPLGVLQTWLNTAAEQVHLSIYLHGEDDQPVGFRFGWMHRGALHALFVGMDYSQHKDLCIYPRMLYDFVEYAIEHQAETVHLGRTAAEMKSGLGAVPIRSAGLTRAANPLLNAMIQPFLKKIIPPTYRVDLPFKKILPILLLGTVLGLGPKARAQENEPTGLNYAELASWAMHPAVPFRSETLQLPRYAPSQAPSVRPAVFYVYPTFYDRGKSWGVGPRDPKHQKEVIDKALPNQAGVFVQSADVYVPYYRQMRIDGYYTQVPEERTAARAAFDTAYSDVVRAYRVFLATVPPHTPIVVASHSQGTNHAERLLREVILPDSEQRSRLLLAYLIGMPIKKNSLEPYCQPCTTPEQTGCFVSWRTFGKGFYPKVHGDSIATINPMTWIESVPTNPAGNHQGILFGSGSLKLPNSLVVSAESGTLQVRELYMPFAVFYRWKNYHIGDYNLFWMNIQGNFEHRISAWNSQNH